jgi:hypothetical protein
VIIKGCDTQGMSVIIDQIYDHYQINGDDMKMRVANDIYMNESQSALIYLLSKKSKMNLELGFYINGQTIGLDESLITNKDNLRLFRKFKSDNNYKIIVAEKLEDYLDFYRMLESNLLLKHNTNPTHNLGEFLSLRNIFGTRGHVLCLCYYGDQLISGMFFVEVRPAKYYTVYIAQNYDLKVQRTGSLIGIVDFLLRNRRFDILDFGICTEDNGNHLNLGLAGFKECSLTGHATYRYTFI